MLKATTVNIGTVILWWAANKTVAISVTGVSSGDSPLPHLDALPQSRYNFSFIRVTVQWTVSWTNTRSHFQVNLWTFIYNIQSTHTSLNSLMLQFSTWYLFLFPLLSTRNTHFASCAAPHSPSPEWPVLLGEVCHILLRTPTAGAVSATHVNIHTPPVNK